RRMVWTDMDRWHWENLSLSPGLHLAPFEATAQLAEPLSARVTFGPLGAAGKVNLGPCRNPEDAVLALPSRRNLAVRFAGLEGSFAAGPADQLAPGQYLAAGILSDVQRHRQAVYQQLLDRRPRTGYLLRPMILTWASPLDLRFISTEE